MDDFDDVTPELLHTAYVEAIYRADEFEFERLRMNFWIDLIRNVSRTMSSQTLYDKFPPVIARTIIVFSRKFIRSNVIYIR